MTKSCVVAPCKYSTNKLNSQGYPGCGVKRFGKSVCTVGRLVWIDANGRLPFPGMEICHRCDNRACIELTHLYEGTRSDNMRDMWVRRRHVRTYLNQPSCKRGHEFTPENTYIMTSSIGTQYRYCRACRKVRIESYGGYAAAYQKMAEYQAAYRKKHAVKRARVERERRARQRSQCEGGES